MREPLIDNPEKIVGTLTPRVSICRVCSKVDRMLFSAIDSTDLKTKQDQRFITMQCRNCGYFPNTDLRRQRLRESCETCMAFYRQSPDEMNDMLVNAFMHHVTTAHPEIDIIE